MRKVLFSTLFLFIIDAITKFFAKSIPCEGITLFKFLGVSFSLDLATNTGIAWGLFPGFPYLLLLFRLFIIAALFIYLFFNRRSYKYAVPIALILAGAIGNAIDLLCYGYVIDFLHFRFFGWSFPIFNFADSCITVGAFLLFLCPQKKQHVNV